ncbi:methyltransferase domain-containing protein [Marinivivus vitaminiproducens]|uniref:methyltransferase domain-containing protein n=1 Tax=Marinivivus vitaminiproducens TaxID=3035935 RepID=UPI0027A14BA7|nr:methyltransferase domain-containing protein [Geminicoccaceae bacterium SCSIO 64248]
MSDSPALFDRPAIRRARTRATPGFADAAFLVDEVAERLLDRLDDVDRRFPLALDLGCHTGQVAARLAGRGGVATLVQADASAAMASRAGGLTVVADEEALPFAGNRFDLVLSCFNLHGVNDLPGTLVQIRRALKPDGLFLAALPGGQTLHELRHALMQAEIETTGGAAPRVMPFTDVRDAGMLLQRAGFALPVVDMETITVTYAHPLVLMRELRAMGEANAVALRSRKPLRRDVLMRAAAIYQETFGTAEGRVRATFEILFLAAWHPHESQQQPLRRGSGQESLAKALGVPLEVLEGKAKRGDPT